VDMSRIRPQCFDADYPHCSARADVLFREEPDDEEDEEDNGDEEEDDEDNEGYSE